MHVEIVDKALAYDDPYSHKTFILVIRHCLDIPSMDHNLIPPFLLREAGLQVRETPKSQLEAPTIDDHAIYDPESFMRIHLKLSGIFSCFPTRALTRGEVETWDEYPIVYLTPDAPSWDPLSSRFADAEDATLDADGDIIQRLPRSRNELLDGADVASLYPAPPMWSDVDAVIDAVCERDDLWDGDNPLDGDCLGLDDDDIRTHVSQVDAALDPALFVAAAIDGVQRSKAAIAFGSTLSERESCALFENVEECVGEAIATLEAVNAGRPHGVSAEHLSKIWQIPHAEAERTLEVTSQLNQQAADSSLARHFATNDRMLRYRRIKSTFYTDTMHAKKGLKSTRQNICAQVFVSDKGFVAVYPMRQQRDYLSAFKMFAKDVGAPEVLVCDPHPSQKSREVKQFCLNIGTDLRLLEQKTQWANRAELYIGLLKGGTRKDMRASNCPAVLWDYCMERRALIFQLTAKGLFQLQGSNPYTATFGETGDISNLCQFDWYQWIYYRDNSISYPYQQECLGRCLGPAKNEGNAMAQWVLTSKGTVVPRRSCRRLTPGELASSNEVERRKRALFDDAIRSKLGDSLFEELPPGVDAPRGTKRDSQGNAIADSDVDDGWSYEPYEDEEEQPARIPEADVLDATGKPLLQQSMADQLINAEVLLPQGEATSLARVVRTAVGSDGKVIGEYNDNPVLNTLIYECEFPDGTVKEYAANQIAESIFDQADPDGHRSRMLKAIVGHKSSGLAVKKVDKYITTKSGQQRLRKTTVGWKLLVEWNDGSRQWQDLSLLKESNPVEIAEYAVGASIDDEPAFAWWVPFTLRKRDVILSSVMTRVRKKSHKYGIEVPNSWDDAIRIDKQNGNTLWQDAIRKEMSNVGVAFQVLSDGQQAPPGWRKSSGHLIFDVKMDFTRKARWVKDGHKTPSPENSAYAGVVSRESIRIALTYAALHGIDIKAADIRNAYLQAPSSEKHYVICGPEFGLENVGRVALIRRALYGGKAAGRDFWHHLRACMEELGFKSSRADPDVWMRISKRSKRKTASATAGETSNGSTDVQLGSATRDASQAGEEYYEYVLLYTDDVLVISDNAESVLREEIGQHFILKEESIGDPGQYLGGKLRKVMLECGTQAWSFGSTQYVKEAVNNVETYLAKKGKKLVAKAPTALSNGYRPELDVSPELESGDASYYHSLIGVLRWIVELGRVDINVEVSMMSSHLALPREGHLEELFHIFAYLKKHHHAEMVFDPTPVEIDSTAFEAQDWSYSQYGCEDMKEELPPNMPEPKGCSMRMRVYVDSDLAGCHVTRRSRTGFVVFLNNAPIYWYSKKQNSCETSTFGAEFCAMKQATEYVRGLRYKLRMMGIRVDEPAFVFGDNQSVLANTTNPASTLKKKSNAIAYHFVREGCARGEWITTYINTHLNIADLMTKALPSGEKRWSFIHSMLHMGQEGSYIAVNDSE